MVTDCLLGPPLERLDKQGEHEGWDWMSSTRAWTLSGPEFGMGTGEWTDLGCSCIGVDMEFGSVTDGKAFCCVDTCG